MAGRQVGRQAAFEDRLRVARQPRLLVLEHRLRLGIDHGADVGGELDRIADDEFFHRAAQHRQDLRRDVGLDAEQAQAEQRWPALLKPDSSVSATTCSGSADESTIIALRPPVSAISGAIGPAARRGSG